MSPLCDKHGHVYGDGCKCPDCDKGEVINVPLPVEGEDNLEDTFLKSESTKRGKK